jgi:type IV pilus assembly protein PilY1
VRDAYYSGAWHTVLVGALGAGGQGYFALDVTVAEDAATTTEALAGAKVLWEFGDGADANLGYSYGRPSVIRLGSAGTWAVLIPNGYVNSAADGAVGDGRARLIALDVATGAKLGEIVVDDASDSSGNPNGLSSPSAIDTDGDGHVDTVFAGDIKGNLWRFDVSAAPSGWSTSNATKVFVATHGATRQSITTAPEVSLHPADHLYTGLDLLVMIGTGRLLDNNDYDPLLTATDSVYGLWVKTSTSSPIARTSLLEQTLTESTHTNGARVRTASNNAINWSTHSGWFADLPQGERLLVDPQLRHKRLQMLTTNPMVPSGENWFQTFSYADGGSPVTVVMDSDGNGTLNYLDNVDGNGDGDSGDPEDRVTGQYQQFGLASPPLLVTLNGERASALINHVTAISPVELAPETTDPSDPGLRGGHFDLDVSHDIYPLGSDPRAGTTDKHVHEWDDKTGLTTINYMNIPK